MLPVAIDPAASAAGTRWGVVVQVFGAVIAAGFAFFLAGIPVQVSDSLGNLLSVASVTWGELFEAQFSSRAFFRPLLLAQIKALVDLSFGHYFVMFRAFQVVQVFAAIWLFIRALRVRSRAEAIAAAIAVVVLCGSHTFAGTIREAYPINSYMTVALCCLVALNIAGEGRSRWWTDLLVVAALVLAVGTIETGLLVWVILFAGFVSGWRGVSAGAVGAATALVVAYFVLRFVVLDVGTPDLLERATGFGFTRLEPSQLQERFGADPRPFYAYNVASSIATVLFSEPRAGVWMFVRSWREGNLEPSQYINVVSSAVATLLVLSFAVTRTWWIDPRRWSHGQRLVIVAAAVLAANAAISFPYTKDQIMSAAGFLFAAAVFAAVAAMLASPPRAIPVRLVATVMLAICGVSWSFRVIGLQHNLVHTAFTQRNDWAYFDRWLDEHPDARRDPAILGMVQSLYDRALTRRVPNPHVESSDFEDWFDHHTD
jgi:hypothetical protein